MKTTNPMSYMLGWETNRGSAPNARRYYKQTLTREARRERKHEAKQALREYEEDVRLDAEEDALYIAHFDQFYTDLERKDYEEYLDKFEDDDYYFEDSVADRYLSDDFEDFNLYDNFNDERSYHVERGEAA